MFFGCILHRFPHEEFGDIPIALIVREQGSNVSKKDIMDYVANKVIMYRSSLVLLFQKISWIIKHNRENIMKYYHK